MALISLQEVSLGFGGPLLLEEVSLQIEQGESVGLLADLTGFHRSLINRVEFDLQASRLTRCTVKPVRSGD